MRGGDLVQRVQVARPWLDEAERAAIGEVLQSGWLTKGPRVSAFEDRVGTYLGIDHVVAVSSGTTALHLALAALGIGPGDAVVVPAFTFPASANVVRHCGAEPILLDIDLRSFNMTADALEALLSDETEPTPRGPRIRGTDTVIKAIMPVHLFGLPVAMGPVLDVARRYNLRIVEDAACAFGARDGRAFCGTIGDLGCFSFHPRKIITTGEGGVVVTRDAALAEAMRSLRDHGGCKQGGRLVFARTGYNYRLSDIHAAIGISQMDKVDRIIRRYDEIARWYDEGLAGDPRIETPAGVDGRVYQAYVVRLGDAIDRDRVIASMAACGIECVLGTYSLCEQPPFSESCRPCPEAGRAARSSLALPLHVGLDKETVRAVCDALTETLTRQGAGN
jgi:dTDP-4-amino-4,6-dideoxygalactose transaminase